MNRSETGAHHLTPLLQPRFQAEVVPLAMLLSQPQVVEFIEGPRLSQAADSTKCSATNAHVGDIQQSPAVLQEWKLLQFTYSTVSGR